MKRGSALLIVLGMIAFMVISAVAFSAFMRNSRLPSSYLRRTSYSRLLVKAALAEAIDLIDVSIGDNPHPGVGTRAYPYPRRSTANESSSTRQRNYWVNRVFIGTNGLMNASETVSTLTFEALAYLPPALINETRYYSRRSAAACWHNLGFDSGRYAFTAVDVSDHFDINRLAANAARSSSDNGRLSLAYVFENKAHTGYATKPSAWDSFMDQFVEATKAAENGGNALGSNHGANQSVSKLPLTSLADFNLAINKQGWAETMSPFCRYVTSKGGTDFVTSSTGADSEMMRLMTFVTDGYYPSSIVPEKVEGQKEAFVPYDLNDEENQPFTKAELEQTARSAKSAFDNPRKGVTRLYDSLCGLGVCALWDYLDTDNVPLSLAIPTTERVPMVCAIQPQLGNCKLKVTATPGAVTPDGGSYPQSPANGQEIWVNRTDDYKIDATAFSSAFMGAKLNALVAFPFRRNADLANDTFKIDGRLSLFIGASDMRFRTDAADDVLHLSDSEAKRGQEIPTTRTCENGVFHSAFPPQQLTFNQVNRTEDALREVQFDLSSSAGQVGSWLGANPLLKVTYRWKQTYVVPEGAQTGQWLPAAPEDEKAALSVAIANGNTPVWSLPPLKRNGTVNGDYLNATSLANMILNPSDGAKVKVYAGVWLRVRNSDGYLVDLVPACMQDDDSLNLFINNTAGGFSSDARTIGGAPYPLMRFDCTGEFTLGLEEMKSGVLANGLDVAPTPAAVMVGDPRYNYAPEHWFAMPGAYSKQEWLTNCGVGGDGRDRDIFMATSDAGYLQSPYEFAFLPRLTNLEGYGTVQLEGDYLTPDDGRVTFAANFSDARNHGFMWKTYRPYRIKGYPADDFEGTGFTAQGSGMRVNPYAATETVTLAALANTPNSWMVCSTNENADCAVPKSDRKAENFNKKYCFNMMGPAESKFEWEDLRKIAGNLQTAMRRGDGDWEEGFRSLDWAGLDNEDVFAGVELSGTTCDLNEVDRKFLYGYWHDAFAPKQQLFLVFVRAEPMMMGGGAIGQTPPQLGARAVALVWRDPVKRGSEDGDPHSTRILFYRQFD